MKISFTTLGCPDWDLDTICRRGREYGYEGVDFRGLQETMDVTLLPAFTSGVAQTRRQLADAGMEVSGISSSIRVCVPEKLEENVEEARRSIRWPMRWAATPSGFLAAAIPRPIPRSS